MMFHGTYPSNYYRKLQRFVHKEYRKSQGIYNLKQLFQSKPSVIKLKSIVKLGYYIPSSFVDKLKLKALSTFVKAQNFDKDYERNLLN